MRAGERREGRQQQQQRLTASNAAAGCGRVAWPAVDRWSMGPHGERRTWLDSRYCPTVVSLPICVCECRLSNETDQRRKPFYIVKDSMTFMIGLDFC